MGERSRRRRARRALLVPIVMPIIRAVSDRVRKARPRAAYRLALLLGTLFRWSRFTRSTIRRNLRLSLGRDPRPEELRSFERAYYNHFALLLVEFLRQPALTEENLMTQFEAEGLERVKELYDSGQGIIFATGHVGSWELALHAAALFGVPVEALVKVSGFEALDAWVHAIRCAGGAKTRDSKGSLWGLKKALDHGHAIGILADQEVRQGMIFTPFFGIPAATSSGPALLHRLTGSPIIVVTAQRIAPFRYRFTVDAEIRHAKTADKDADLRAITAQVSKALETALRRHPEQWLWSHRRWRRRPEGEPEPFAHVDETPGLDLGVPPAATC